MKSKRKGNIFIKEGTPSKHQFSTWMIISSLIISDNNKKHTMRRKNMNLPYSIRMYWTKLPTVHLQQNFFEKTPLEVGSSHIYASFGTFCVQIGQLFEAQLDRIIWNRRHFPSKTVILPFSNIFQRLTVPRKIDQFGRERCQKKCKDVSNQHLWDVFQEHFAIHEWLTVKNLFSTYVWSKVDSFFVRQCTGNLNYIFQELIIERVIKIEERKKNRLLKSGGNGYKIVTWIKNAGLNFVRI